MTTWQEGLPIELIRFAGANRLKVTINYRALKGRVGPRTVEPYSLRYSQQGNLLVMVVNDQSQIRSYRADRIASVRIEPESFLPRYLVEF
ncbi:WYL domain-containing protein [Candidatus Poriferisocius sp.]|uniref:WYL domain-containing protein n=1 Tax=Candidatus Poriferisocius sp. TaxID=3101276 RepID=UPI003B02D820